MEGLNQIVTGKLISLSEQELVDCSKENHGCDGGLMQVAFEYIINNGGIDTEKHYPFKGVQTKCNPNRAKAVSIDGYEEAPEKDEKSLQKAVTNQPVSVSIDAGGDDFSLYQSVSDRILSPPF